MILVTQSLIFFSCLSGIIGNPLSSIDKTILEMMKMKTPLMNKKFSPKYSVFGEANDLGPWKFQGLQNLEIGKPMISRPVDVDGTQVMQNRFPATAHSYNQMFANKMHHQSLAPFSDPKDPSQFPAPNFGMASSPNTQLPQQKCQDNPSFPDPETIAMQSFPGDINVAALHAMNLRNPSMPSFDLKSFLRDQMPDNQRKIQQQLRNFGNDNQESGQMKMTKKPEQDGMFDSSNLNPFSARKLMNQNRGNPRENTGFPDSLDYPIYPGRS